ncbi:hypothetical protein J6590_056674 [Homalodisca vitripennis]|nr:hypothetical protein J6590_056674 [Homalodisca vitripennis]
MLTKIPYVTMTNSMSCPEKKKKPVSYVETMEKTKRNGTDALLVEFGCMHSAAASTLQTIIFPPNLFKGALYHRPEITVRCFKNPLGALAKSVVGREMSSYCGGDRNFPSASDICRAGDPSQERDVRLSHALERTGMG